VADAPVTIKSRAREGWLQHVMRDSEGWTWITTDDKSVGLDADGEEAASLEGRVTLEDSEGGLWLIDSNLGGTPSIRYVMSGGSLELEVPGLFTNAGLALAPDDTVWALTASALIRVRAGDGRLAIVERYPIRTRYGDQIWCDRRGRVWHKHQDNRSNKRVLLRYATPREALTGR
jgi:hypothetical protein